MSWARMRDQLHQRCMAKLTDGNAEYRGRDGSPVIYDIPVMVDFHPMQNGPQGTWRSEQIMVTWQRNLLCEGAARGGMFLFGGRRLVVEETVSDGHMVTAACMEDDS
ncbi:hypothetical protein D3C84_642100 [compost metagenome]